MKSKGLIIVALICIAATIACKKYDLDKLSGTNWKPSLAVPFVDSELDVYDILAAADSNNLIVIDEDTRLLALVYEGELFSFAAKDIVNLPNTSASTSFTPAAGTMPASGTYTMTDTQTISYSPTTGVEIIKMLLKAGSLKIDVSAYPFGGDVTLNIHIPGLTKSGVEFDQNVSLSNVNVSTSFDLTGYIFDMSKTGSFNEFDVNTTLTFTASSGTPIPATQIDVDMGFNDLEFEEIYGDIGTQTISTDKDSILIRVFQSALNGTFHLTNPKIRVNVTNTFGFANNIDFTKLETITYQSDPPVAVQIQYNNQTAPFDFVDVAASTTAPVVETKEIDKTNSDIITIMEPTPKYVHHQVQITSTSAGSSTTYPFIKDDSYLKVETEVELPLEGYSGGWLLQDTVEFSFGDNNLDEIEQVLLRTTIGNRFPVDASLKLTLLDSNYNYMAVLLEDDKNLIESAQVDSDGKVIAPTETVTDLIINDENSEHLFNAKYVIVTATANTTDYSNQKQVKIYEDYTMRVQIGIMVDASVKVEF